MQHIKFSKLVIAGAFFKYNVIILCLLYRLQKGQVKLCMSEQICYNNLRSTSSTMAITDINNYNAVYSQFNFFHLDE